VLEEASRLGLDKLSHHVAQDRSNGIEPLVSGANVVESIVVEEDLLNNENSNGLAKL
jgi:hypothetical protein